MSSEVRLVSDLKSGNFCGTAEDGEIVIKEEMEDEATFVDLLMKPNDHQDDGGPYQISYLAGNVVQVTIKEEEEVVVIPTSSNQHLTSTTTAGKSGRFQCSLCQASFPDYQTTLEHISGYGRGFKPQRCPNCRLAFCTKSELSKHQEERHRKSNLSKSDQKKSGNHVQVTIKEEVELTSAETRPLPLASKPSSCVCPNCQQAFYSKSELSQHQLEHSNCGQAPLTSESEEPFFDQDLIEEEEDVSIKEEDEQLTSAETPLLLASKPPSKPVNLKPGPSYACTICRASFPDKATTLQHIRISHKSKGHDRQRATKSKDVEATKRSTKANNKPLVIYWPAIKAPGQSQKVDDGGFHSQNAPRETASGLTLEREKIEAPWKRKSRSLSCPLCPRLIHRSWEMPEHLELHQAASAATCSLCGAVYRGEPQLAVHRTKVHPEAVEPPKPKKPKPKKPKPEKPKRVHRAPKKKRKSTKEAVLLQPPTPTWTIQPSSNGTFSCQFCSKAYRIKYNLTVHLRQHTGERPYLCSLCPAAYSSSYHLTQHEKAIHSASEQPASYTCPSCPHLIYTTARYFRRHLRLKHPPPGTDPLSHLNRHLCEVCGKAFAYPVLLADHRRAVHTGERPYGCPDCDYRAPSKNNLANHRKQVHTGESGGKRRTRPKASRPHRRPQASSPSNHDKTIESNLTQEAEEGGVSPTESKPLRRHTREQRGEKVDRRISCPQCKRIFYTKCRLAKHVKEHHERQSPWSCDQCGALYGGKMELTRHRSIVHGDGTLHRAKRRKVEMEETAVFQDHPEVKEEDEEEEIVFCKTIK